VAEQRAARVRSVRPPRPVDRGTGASGQTRGEATRRTGLIGRWARPVSRDRTRPVAKNPFWTLSVLGPDAGTVASGQFQQRVRSRGLQRESWRPDAETCPINFDRRVRSL
jgi:hypothetical protein